jgi:hypothetical protein
MKTAIILVLAALLPACTAPIESSSTDTTSDISQERSPAEPTKLPPPPKPACQLLTCNDALEGQHGAFCPGSSQLVSDLQVCSDNHCQGTCDDNPFHVLSSACLSCLDDACPTQMESCESDR